jgi:hypothetical protein
VAVVGHAAILRHFVTAMLSWLGCVAAAVNAATGLELLALAID